MRFPVNEAFIHKGCDAAAWRQVFEQRHDLGFAPRKIPEDLVFRITNFDVGPIDSVSHRL